MVKITGKQNGPLLMEVDGQFVRMKDGKEETLEQNVIALCRCGASANKPFCDGSHKRIDFQADAEEIHVK